MNGLRKSAASRTDRFQQEMSTMKESSSSVRVEWTDYTTKTETHYLEDITAVENGKTNLDEVLQNWWVPLLPEVLFFVNLIIYR